MSNKVLFNKFLQPQALPWIALSSLILGAVCRYLTLRKEHVALLETGGALCDALFIASFLGLLVDPTLKADLLRETLRDIFPYLYGYSLPDELKQFLNQTILRTRLCRTNCEVEWTIDELPTNNAFFSVRLHTSFSMLNFTDEPLEYTHNVIAISDTQEDKSCVQSIYCLRGDLYLYEDRYVGSQTSGPSEGVEKDHRKGAAITIPPSKGQPSNIRFGVYYYSEVPMKGAVDQFIVAEMTTGIRVKIIVPKKLEHYTFSIIPEPTEKIIGQRPKLDASSQIYCCQWTFRRLLLPNETVAIRWRVVEESMASDS